MSFNWTGGTLTMGGGGHKGRGSATAALVGWEPKQGRCPPPQHTIRPRAAGWLVTA